jgi:hypothetical protein
VSTPELSGAQVLEQLGITGRSRWLGAWTFFVLALAVGRVGAGGHAVRIDELVFGMPLSWLVGWSLARGWRATGFGLGALVVLTGGLIGLLA